MPMSSSKGAWVTTLAVPESAVLSTGERTVVFVTEGEGSFEPREVTTGMKVRNYYEIKSRPVSRRESRHRRQFPDRFRVEVESGNFRSKRWSSTWAVR